MKVKELIEELKKYPDNTDVLIDYINIAYGYDSNNEEEERDIEKISYYDGFKEIHLCTYDIEKE